MDRQALACENLAVGRQVIPGGRLAISPALAAAQRKLECLRLAYRPNQTQRQTQTPVQVGRFTPPDFLNVQQRRPKCLPNHLGWNSGPVTKAYRLALKNLARRSEKAAPKKRIALKPLPPPQPAATAVSESFVKLSPDIALAILRHKLASPGRVWLLLRYLDEAGKGWVASDDARKRLTNKKSPTAVCGGRQLRNLLAAGENIFWQRDGERIWLRSMAKVAAVLDLERLNGRPVKVPLSVLLESIGTVRAHLYATFHSSRNGREETAGNGDGKPISREMLKGLSSATRRTQQLYEKRAGVQRRSNYAIGNLHSVEAEQNLAWKKGRAVFRFHDKKGIVGKSGQQYVAWQLPNSYNGPHDILSKGHQRQINRRLADLLNEGITGNGEKSGNDAAVETQNGMKRPIFYRNGAKAASEYNRTPEQDYYWRSRMKRGQFSLWHHLPAVDKGKNGR